MALLCSILLTAILYYVRGVLLYDIFSSAVMCVRLLFTIDLGDHIYTVHMQIEILACGKLIDKVGNLQ